MRSVEVFGRYHVLDHIARGGMAEIVLARPASGTRTVCALKRILPAFSRDLQFVSMFIDEARITIGLSHDNIVQLHDFGQVDGTYFMAMEYVDGTDLAALLRAHMEAGLVVPPIVVAAIMRDVCLGLAHAHTLTDTTGQPLRIVHRDVSPHNVLLSSTGQVKITDFGIAAARNKLSLTTPGTVLGKAPYMAPEQATGSAVDHRTDLWAVGVMLWEALTGARLFAGETPVRTLERVLSDVIIAPATRRPGVPLALDALTMSLLSRVPDERPQSAADVAHALDAIIQLLARTSPLTTNGRFDTAALSRWLQQVPFSPTTGPMRPVSPLTTIPSAVAEKRAFDDDVIAGLVERARREHDPWLLYDIGQRAAALGQRELSLSAWRTAAVVFASRGLLVQMLAVHHVVRSRVGDTIADRELLTIADLSPGNVDELRELLHTVDHHDFASLVTTTDAAASPVPLLGALGARELVQLARVIAVRAVIAGDVVIAQDDTGDDLFAVARGRFVVSCRPPMSRPAAPSPAAAPMMTTPEYTPDATINDDSAIIDPLVLRGQREQRVFLAGLSDGDFFGEFSFLTERPRSATVEAVAPGLVLVLRREAVAPLISADPAFTAPLLAFYKERVVELMMARSPVFSVLPPEARRALLDNATTMEVDDGKVIVEEGSTNSSFFFIRRGTVEVFRRDAAGLDIFINKLGQGQFFGEIAALRGTPRNVSVRALGNATLFRIEGKALQAAIASDPRAKQRFDATIARRTAEARARTEEHHRVFFGT
jgi:serine/threonine protein kinase/CRP-like cAMP-binding protein